MAYIIDKKTAKITGSFLSLQNIETELHCHNGNG